MIGGYGFWAPFFLICQAPAFRAPDVRPLAQLLGWISAAGALAFALSAFFALAVPRRWTLLLLWFVMAAGLAIFCLGVLNSYLLR